LRAASREHFVIQVYCAVLYELYDLGVGVERVEHVLKAQYRRHCERVVRSPVEADVLLVRNREFGVYHQREGPCVVHRDRHVVDVYA
jgi:hypothetical protein